MRIGHLSDWHGEVKRVPYADAYVCSGDMQPDFRTWTFDVPGRGSVEWLENEHLIGGREIPRPEGTFLSRTFDPAVAQAKQEEYQRIRGHGHLRGFLTNRDAPVICVRGNHDCADLAPMFGGEVFEITHDPTRTYAVECDGQRLVFGGFRGITIYANEWADELPPHELLRRVEAVPRDVDVLVTHAPPLGVLDVSGEKSFGTPQLLRLLANTARDRHIKAHLFGHAHGSWAVGRKWDTVVSNAATGFNILEF